MEILDSIFRVVHVGTAVVIVGGVVFTRFVLLPAAEQLDDESHSKLRQNVLVRWRRIVHIGIALFLISGFYNYFRAMPQHSGDGLYHALVGTKIILAFVVFFLSSVIIGSSQKFQSIKQNPKKWLGIVILLAALIIGISGFVKVRQSAVAPQPDAQNDPAS